MFSSFSYSTQSNSLSTVSQVTNTHHSLLSFFILNPFCYLSLAPHPCPLLTPTRLPLTTSQIANDIRALIRDYRKSIPTILEIPSKDQPYDPEQVRYATLLSLCLLGVEVRVTVMFKGDPNNLIPNLLHHPCTDSI